MPSAGTEGAVATPTAVQRIRNGLDPVMVCSTVPIVVGAFAMWWAGRENSLPTLAAGAVFMAGGVLVQHRRIARTIPFQDESTESNKLAIGFIVAASVVAGVGLVADWAAIVACGIAFAALAVAPISLWVARSAKNRPALYVAIGLIASLFGWVLLAFTQQRLLGALLVLLGLITFRTGVLPAVTQANASLICRAAIAGFVIGVGFMIVAVRVSITPPALVGSFLISVSLMTLASGWPQLDYSPIGAKSARGRRRIARHRGRFRHLGRRSG